MKSSFVLLALFFFCFLIYGSSNSEIIVETNNGPVIITEINSGVSFSGNGFNKVYYFANSNFSVSVGNYYANNNVIICGGQKDSSSNGVVVYGRAKSFLIKFAITNLDTVFCSFLSAIAYPYAAYNDRVTFIYQLSNQRIIATSSWNGGQMHQDTKYYVLDYHGNISYEDQLPYTMPAQHGTPPYITNLSEEIKRITFNCWFFWSCSPYDPTTIAYACINNNGEIVAIKPPCDSTPCVVTNGIGNEEPIKDYSLKQNFPNPFNPVTKIYYSLPKNSFVSLKVFDISGREVKSFVNNYQNAGNHEITFDAGNLSSGTYFYRLTAGDFTETKKMVLVK